MKFIGIMILMALLALVAFHIIHYRLFCRYRMIKEKSHCGTCGHRNTCKKFHF